MCEEASSDDVEEPGPAPDESEEEKLQAGQRLRELARSQEDVPAEELASELQKLLNQIVRRR